MSTQYYAENIDSLIENCHNWHTLASLHSIRREINEMNNTINQTENVGIPNRHPYLTDVNGNVPEEFLPNCEECGYPITGYCHEKITVNGDSIALCQDCIDNLVECNHCNNLCIEDRQIECYRINNESVNICHKCIDNITKICSDCDGIFYNDDIIDVNGSNICNVCLDENYVKCNDCGDYERFDCATWIECSEYFVCEYCSQDYEYCGECMQYYPSDTMVYSDDHCHYFCESCALGNSHSGIVRSYHDNPHKIFNRTSKDILTDNRVYLGVELETECKYSEDIENYLYNEYSDNESKLYLMEDGSLDHGFELISQPMTLDYHHNFEWQSILSDMIDESCDSEASTCGLHVHISKKFYDDNTQIKIAYFVNMFESFFTRMARRDSRYYCQYKSKTLESFSQSDRYEAVNFRNSATIEFRIFRGTLSYPDFMSAIELTHAVCEFCKVVNNNVLLSRQKCIDTFIKFVDCSKVYRFLPSYIARNR